MLVDTRSKVVTVTSKKPAVSSYVAPEVCVVDTDRRFGEAFYTVQHTRSHPCSPVTAFTTAATDPRLQPDDGSFPRTNSSPMPCETFRNVPGFYGEQPLAPALTPNRTEHETISYRLLQL